MAVDLERMDYFAVAVVVAAAAAAVAGMSRRHCSTMG